MQQAHTLKDRLRVLLRKEMWILVPIYCFGLIPLATFIAYLGTLLDRRLGIPPFLPVPLNYALFAVLIFLGMVIIWWSYSFLILEGEGDPTGILKNCRRLVKEGPYSFVRHPSVIGKLLGVIGLGCLFRSFCFTFIFVPLLLGWSWYYNYFIQERRCVKFYGEEYLRYRAEVPMLVPRKERIIQSLRSIFLS